VIRNARRAFIPSSHNSTCLPASSSKTARPEQKPLDHTSSSSSPTSSKVTDPKSKSPKPKSNSPHVKKQTTGNKSTSAKTILGKVTTAGKSHSSSNKKDIITESKKKPEVKNSSHTVKSKRKGNTSPHVKKQTASNRSTSGKVTTVNKSHTSTKKESAHKPKKPPTSKNSSPRVMSKAEVITKPAPKKRTVGSATSSDSLKGKKTKTPKPQLQTKTHSNSSV